MKKIFALCASVALLGSVAAQAADAGGPVPLTATQMDVITAGQTQTQNANYNTLYNTNSTSQSATANASGAYSVAVASNYNRTDQRNSIRQSQRINY